MPVRKAVPQTDIQRVYMLSWIDSRGLSSFSWDTSEKSLIYSMQNGIDSERIIEKREMDSI